MKTRKVPLRMCLGCKEMKDKRELVRVVKNKDGEISIDMKGKMPGRGAYICKSQDCLNLAVKGKRLERAFGSRIEDCIYEKLKEQMGEVND